VGLLIRFIWLRLWTDDWSCEHGDESSCSMKFVKFLGQAERTVSFLLRALVNGFSSVSSLSRIEGVRTCARTTWHCLWAQGKDRTVCGNKPELSGGCGKHNLVDSTMRHRAQLHVKSCIFIKHTQHKL
jgi:hypothetical protein